MTIAVIWQEDGNQWCAADTRLVGGPHDEPTTDIAAKIYTIPVAVLGAPHQWHHRTQYGFAFAGSASPASMTAITASTFLQKLIHPGGLTDPPAFEDVALLVRRLAKRFMGDWRKFGADGIFSAALFGWCPRETKFKIAHIDGRKDAIGFTVDLSYPLSPKNDGEPWLVLGNGDRVFKETFAAHRVIPGVTTKRVPLRVIDKMVTEGREKTVGGATSIGIALQNGFELFCAFEPVTPGEPTARRTFNGLDMDTEVGQVGEYIVATSGVA